MSEVSPKQGMLLAPGWMRQDASQIVPPRSSDPMTEGPLCQIRREARARGAVAALVSENLNAVDFNRPNREGPVVETFMSAMLDRGHHLVFCGAVARQLVRDHHT